MSDPGFCTILGIIQRTPNILMQFNLLHKAFTGSSISRSPFPPHRVLTEAVQSCRTFPRDRLGHKLKRGLSPGFNAHTSPFFPSLIQPACGTNCIILVLLEQTTEQQNCCIHHTKPDLPGVSEHSRRWLCYQSSSTLLSTIRQKYLNVRYKGF